MKNKYSLEKLIRTPLRHHPLLYTFIGGVGIVLFWKGVWDIADLFPIMHGIVSLVVGTTILLVTGLFISFFAGDSVVLHGIEEEEKETEELLTHISRIEKSLESLRKKIS